VLHSQPELLAATRIMDLDLRAWANDPARVLEALAHLQRAGASLPPRLEPRWEAALPIAVRAAAALPSAVAPGLAAYGRIIQYWSQGSPPNLRSLIGTLARASGRDGPKPAPPVVLPATALWHPAAGRHFTELEAYRAWYDSYCPPTTHPRPRAGVILFRQYVASGNHDLYDEAIAALEREGLEVIAGYGHLDHSELIDAYFRSAGIDVLINLTGFNLVGSMAHPQPERAQALLRSLGVPYLVALPLLFQSQDEWRADRMGLAPAQTALQVTLPELEGGIEPRVYGGRTADDRQAGVPGQIRRLARRAARWASLRRKPPAERKIAVTLFRFPPDKGAIGTAAYLDVFESLYRFLLALKREGYRVELPADADGLRRALLGATDGSGPDEAGAVAAELDVWRYKQYFPQWRRLCPQWGEPPGAIDVRHGALLIRGRSFGHVFVGIQPSFGYEGDPLRLLFAPEASPSHSFAAYYVWLRHVWGADCLVHFGTHGALEFMPGKSVGLTPECYPDLLLDDLPHAYFYSIDNPSEATIAKRRGYATLVSYLSPPLSAAGLYRELSAMRDALDEWTAAPPGPNRQRIEQTLAELVRSTGIEGEVPAPADWRDAEAVAGFVSRLRAYLRELADRLVPVGLHVAGEPPDAEALRTFLLAEARVPRAEEGLPALFELLPEADAAEVVAALARGGERAAEAAAQAVVDRQPPAGAAADPQTGGRIAAWI
ncbi:MAG TPA: cobaltochelatase subunit CobN, partial [Limnochordia bacterium]